MREKLGVGGALVSLFELEVYLKKIYIYFGSLLLNK
jgi:hypothetical protein